MSDELTPGVSRLIPGVGVMVEETTPGCIATLFSHELQHFIVTIRFKVTLSYLKHLQCMPSVSNGE